MKDINEKAMRLLEQLTPLGSEFHNDPQRCFDWVKEFEDSRWEIIKKQLREIRSLKSQGDNWTLGFPDEAGDYWFYGWTYGGTGMKPKFVRVVAIFSMDSITLVGDGQFFYESDNHIGFFQKINMPEPPTLSLREHLHKIAIKENKFS